MRDALFCELDLSLLRNSKVGLYVLVTLQIVSTPCELCGVYLSRLC